ILHIDDAADVTYEDVPYPSGILPPTYEVAHTIRTYGTLDEPLTVHDDIPSLTISVPEKTAAQTLSDSTASP
ncbi:MAG TPA: hypothetical protein VE109_09150, partial [Acidobacteriaceae bacterium]|nr:hypothetical protein [Acidobacteriaceae bacterium]